MVSLFFYAFILGLLFNAAPGAIFAASLRRGIKGGFWPAFMIQIGSLIGDFIWAVLGLSGAAFLFTFSGVKMPLSVAGALLLAWMAYGCFKDAMTQPPEIDDTEVNPPYQRSSDFWVGASLSLSNPINISYWAGLGGTISALGVQDPNHSSFAIFLFGFMLSSILWCGACAGLIAFLRLKLNRFLWVCINILCGIGLAAFAGKVMISLF